ncbi:hypothetical protein PTKIN_Ptkin05aG0042300 [Pterospermum kingtungense]
MALVEVENSPLAICEGIVLRTARTWLANMLILAASKVALGLSELLLGFFGWDGNMSSIVVGDGCENKLARRSYQGTNIGLQCGSYSRWKFENS